jgi:alpha-L-fucosidase 2
VLPALPKAWPEGSVVGLRARGNIKVNIGWKDGKLTGLTLQTPEERDVLVRYGTKTHTFHTRARRPTVLTIDALLKDG